MTTETKQYLALAHKVDTERNGHCGYAHRFTVPEAEEVIRLVGSEETKPLLCGKCNYYHIVKTP